MADQDRVFIFSDNMSLDQTKTLTMEDIALHRHSSVEGCYEVNRDLLLERAILDPDGDKEYAVEMKYGSPVTMQKCEGRYHRGRRAVPAAEFAEGSEKCRWCVGFEDDLLRNARKSLERSKKGWKRLRVAHLTRGGKFTRV